MTFSALYAPQPLQPILAEEFGVTKESAALLTTVTMLPLSIAPILYGYLLESFSSKKLFSMGLITLSGLQLAFFLTNSFAVMLFIRVLVGMAIPAVLTSVMTYISTTSDKGNVQRQMAMYISATILGGFSGRFFSGLIAAYFGWRWTFLMLAVSLAAAFLLVRNLHEAELKISKFDYKAVFEVMGKREFAGVYVFIFATFFMFAAMLNFIPFRVREISETSSAFSIGVMYTGYIMGIVMSLNSLRIVKFFKGEINTVVIALVFYCFTLFLFTVPDLRVMFFGMFLFCCGMFLAHSVASGYVNKIAESRKGITNGLYVSFYYAGGTLGSILPGFVYRQCGWNMFLLSLGLFMASAVVIGRLTAGRGVE
jgi:YNFM family putative membrane transporter